MRFVADQGVKHVFLVTGGGAMHLNDSLAQCKDIEPICNLARAGQRHGRRELRQGHQLISAWPW